MKYLPLVGIIIYSTLGLNAQTVTKAFPNASYHLGGLLRMDTTQPHIYLLFTGGDYKDGGDFIHKTLEEKQVPAHFFFTGDFYRKKTNRRLIKRLLKDGHYLGAHSDQHLLYAAWENRDSLLVDKELFTKDLLANYKEMNRFGIEKSAAPYFLPPYEWYNQRISDWTTDLGLTLINFSPGTRSNADYTTPDMGDRYLSSAYIYRSILEYEQKNSAGLNGFLLLLHIGTHPSRADKFYDKLPALIEDLRKRGYSFKRLPDMD